MNPFHTVVILQQLRIICFILTQLGLAPGDNSQKPVLGLVLLLYIFYHGQRLNKEFFSIGGKH